MTLSTSTRKIGGVSIVACEGKLVLGEESATLRLLVKELLTKSPQIVIDLGEVSYIDSSGLGTLVALYTSARNSGGEIRLAGLHPRAKELLQVTRLVTVFEVFDRAEDAAASFSRGVARTGAAGRTI